MLNNFLSFEHIIDFMKHFLFFCNLRSAARTIFWLFQFLSKLMIETRQILTVFDLFDIEKTCRPMRVSRLGLTAADQSSILVIWRETYHVLKWCWHRRLVGSTKMCMNQQFASRSINSLVHCNRTKFIINACTIWRRCNVSARISSSSSERRSMQIQTLIDYLIVRLVIAFAVGCHATQRSTIPINASMKTPRTDRVDEDPKNRSAVKGPP